MKICINVVRILGDSFLRTFYTAFNVQDKLVGLAQSTAHRTSQECEVDANMSADDLPPATNESSSSSAAAGSHSGSETAATPAPAQEAVATVKPTTPAPQSAPAPGEEAVNPTGQEGDSTRDGSTRGEISGDNTKSNSSDAAEEEGGIEKENMVVVASAASLGTLVVVGAIAGVVVMIRKHRQRHRHTKLGTLGHGGFEMSTSKTGGGGGGGGGGGVRGSTVSEADDDFLQANPGGYRSNGSGSHVYRVDNGAKGYANGRSMANGGVDEEEEEDGDEVEVDFAGGLGAGQNDGAVAGGGGRLGRLLGPGRAGFARFNDSEESMIGNRSPGHGANV